jgi:protein tyrosine/serine phosphatase
VRSRRDTSDASRWIELAQVDNIRDLGGLPVDGGGVVRRGVLLRASTLQHVTGADVETLVGGLGLRTVLDLRGRREAAREGHGLLEDTPVQRINLPVRRARSATSDAVPEEYGADLAGFYLAMLEGSGESLVNAARIVGDAERHAVLFHCAAGKDRTGLLAALLLDAVGVPAEAIVADYALTGVRIARIRSRLTRLPSYRTLPAVEHGFMAADPEVMDRFLNGLRVGHGGAARWLLQAGLTTAELGRLRDALVEPAPAARS